MSDNATKPRVYWASCGFTESKEIKYIRDYRPSTTFAGHWTWFPLIEKKAYDELKVHFKALSIVCDDLIPENSSLQKQLDEKTAELEALKKQLGKERARNTVYGKR